MRILYDGCIYYYQQAGGINRYFSYIIRNLPGDYAPYLTAPSNLGGVNAPEHPNLRLLKYRPLRPGAVFTPLQRQYFNYFFKTTRFDLLHPTFYELLFETELRGLQCPLVTTVHDMVHELFSSTLDPTGKESAMKRRAAEAADAIICVSHNTRKDLLERFRVNEERVFVIYHGSHLGSLEPIGKVPDRPYFLYVGSRKAAYKNFPMLLAAMAELRVARPELLLCLAGPPLGDDERRQIAELALEDAVVEFEYPADAHLAKLYRHSVALAYPSAYEGFGIPPLEAMTCGTAVVAANTSSLPEVVGEAGILVDPTRLDDLVEAMRELLDSPIRREVLARAGLVQAQKFSWQKAASETVEVYQKVAAGAR